MSRMTMDFDPRAWNLLAGFALVTGCGARTISLGETSVTPRLRPTSESKGVVTLREQATRCK